MKTFENDKEELIAAEKTVQEIHNFYLILFVYIVMMIYLHWIDLSDGFYNWAYWPAIGFTASLIWFAAEMLPLGAKSKWIFNELKNNYQLNQSIMNSQENYSTREYESAKKRVEEKIGFYIHLTVYVIINSFFVYLSIFHSYYFWATWPIFGWGIGLFFHGMRVFGTMNNSKWRERQIRKEMERQRKLKEKLDQN